MKHLLIPTIISLSFFLIGCAQEEVPKHMQDFIDCQENPSSLMRYSNQCVIGEVVYTPNQIINVSQCTSYNNGCNECEIIESRLLSLDCEQKICVEQKEPTCIK